jgi:hypothetical protein
MPVPPEIRAAAGRSVAQFCAGRSSEDYRLESEIRGDAIWQRATGRWERYDAVGPASDVAALVAEIDADPDGVLWG